MTLRHDYGPRWGPRPWASPSPLIEMGAMDIHQAPNIVLAAIWVLMSLCPCLAAQATQISMALGKTNMVARD